MLHTSRIEFGKPALEDEMTIKKRKKIGSFYSSNKSHIPIPIRALSMVKNSSKIEKNTKGKNQVNEIFENLDENQRFRMLENLIETSGLSSQLQFQLLLKLDSHLKMDPMDVIPVELGLYVFSFLDRKDLSRAALVCKKWKELAYDRSLLIQKLKEGFLYCGECYTPLSRDEDVISRKYRLDYSLAYHMKDVRNVELGKVERIEFPGGFNYKICPASCRKCKAEIGIKYLSKIEEDSEEDPEETLTNFQHELHDNLSGEVVNHPSENCIGTFLLKKKMISFPGEPQVSVLTCCQGCDNQVGKELNIISWSYCLRGQEAFQFTTLQNVEIGESKRVSYSSGQYTVADAICGQCHEVIGIKYLQAKDATNAYKIGTYLVEKPKVRVIAVTIPTRRDSSDSLSYSLRKGRKSSLLSLFSFLRKSGQQA